MPTITVYPADYDHTDHAYQSIPSNYPLSNAMGEAHNSSAYAAFNLVNGGNSESYVYYTFDLSEIPRNAIIQSVTCQAGMYGPTSARSRTTLRQVQLFSGSTAKGSAVGFNFKGSTDVATLSGGTWTRAELDNIRLRIYVTRSARQTSTTTACYFRGASLTVEYSVPENTALRVRQAGRWVPVQSIWQKQNGIWVQVDETVLDTSTKYIRGN